MNQHCARSTSAPSVLLHNVLVNSLDTVRFEPRKTPFACAVLLCHRVAEADAWETSLPRHSELESKVPLGVL